jgi:hypothetical protein
VAWHNKLGVASDEAYTGLYGPVALHQRGCVDTYPESSSVVYLIESGGHPLQACAHHLMIIAPISIPCKLWSICRLTSRRIVAVGGHNYRAGLFKQIARIAPDVGIAVEIIHPGIISVAYPSLASLPGF